MRFISRGVLPRPLPVSKVYGVQPATDTLHTLRFMDNTSLSSFSPGYALSTESHVDTAPPSIHASLNWAPSQHSPIHQNSLFSLQNRVSDLDYPSPASSVPSPPYQRQSHQHAALNNSAITSDKNMHVPFPQVEPVIGPDRILTRRQRAALDQTTLGRRMSVPSSLARGDRQDPVPVCL